jgi:hypothetical protein
MQVIKAPEFVDFDHSWNGNGKYVPKLFLAGSINMGSAGDWAESMQPSGNTLWIPSYRIESVLLEDE